ncbi:MAG: hypothetical protein ABIL88_05730 [candidate division WOR-3 bacterium]
MPFYIVPSLPFFALAFSELLALDGLEKSFDKIKSRYKFALILTLTLINLLLAYNSMGKVRSKNPFYTDLVINPPVEKIHLKVGICPDKLFSDWETVAIAQRYLKWTFVFGWQKYNLVDIEGCKYIPPNCKKYIPKALKSFPCTSAINYLKPSSLSFFSNSSTLIRILRGLGPSGGDKNPNFSS